MSCTAPLGTPAPAREVRKTVTVVFCDITGSTALGEKLDPEALRRVMGRYFEAMRTALEQHGGTVEKFIGDAVMAVFGIPTVHEDDALRAIRAAAEMREALRLLNKELQRDQGTTLACRIGVNTGKVVAGDPTAGQSLVTGDAVNLAARLEQAATPGEILLGAETDRLVRDAVVAEPVERLDLKGKSEPVAAFRLVSVASGAPGRMLRMASPMVGRSRELAALHQAFDRAVADQACQLFTILAPAGVGKSRLIEEFLDGIADATVLRGRCLPYGEGITYFPVLEIVKQAAGLADFDSPELVESKICAALEDEEQQDVVCNRIAQLMGVTDIAAPEETFWAIRRMLEAVARHRALVLVFDDVHWGEATFLDLIEHVADWSRDAPILLACMARPELLDARPTWAGGKLNATTASLEPLSEEESEKLIANLLGAAEVAVDLRSRIAEAAEGNPLFVEEMLAMLIDDGLLARDDDRWVPMGDLSQISVPPTITALLSARLDRLTVGERDVLGRAAVVGKEFFRGAVRELTPEAERGAVAEHLKALVRKELVRPDRSTLPSEDAFRFRHLLIRDAAYDAMPKELRADLHERFAAWLERVAGERIAEQEEILGYHLEQAYRLRAELGPIDDRGLALARAAAQHLAPAGRRSYERGDMPGAAQLLGRAAELMPADDPERLDLLLVLGYAHGETGAFESADAILAECADRARGIGDRRREWKAIIERWLDVSYVDPAWIDPATRDAEAALEVFAELGDEAGIAKTWRVISEARSWRGRIVDAEEALERAIDHARRAGDRRQELECLAQLPIAAFWGPTTTAEEGVSLCDEIVERAGGDRKVEALARHESAGFLALQGRFDEAREQEQRSLGILRDLGLTSWLAGTGTLRGYIELLAGDPRAAEREWRDAYELAERIGNTSDVVDKAASLSKALYAQDRLDEAEQFALIAEGSGSERDITTMCTARSARAKVLARWGRLEEAEELARAALDIARRTDIITTLADTLMDLAEVLRISRRGEEERQVLREALDLYERKGNVVSAARTREFLAELEG